MLEDGHFTWARDNLCQVTMLLNNIGDYCIFSEFLKQLLENDWCSLDKVYEVVQMNLGPVMKSFIDAKTQKH